jgi:hypothetical protein
VDAGVRSELLLACLEEKTKEEDFDRLSAEYLAKPLKYIDDKVWSTLPFFVYLFARLFVFFICCFVIYFFKLFIF